MRHRIFHRTFQARFIACFIACFMPYPMGYFAGGTFHATSHPPYPLRTPWNVPFCILYGALHDLCLWHVTHPVCMAHNIPCGAACPCTSITAYPLPFKTSIHGLHFALMHSISPCFLCFFTIFRPFCFTEHFTESVVCTASAAAFVPRHAPCIDFPAVPAYTNSVAFGIRPVSRKRPSRNPGTAAAVHH